MLRTYEIVIDAIALDATTIDSAPAAFAAFARVLGLRSVTNVRVAPSYDTNHFSSGDVTIHFDATPDDARCYVLSLDLELDDLRPIA